MFNVDRKVIDCKGFYFFRILPTCKCVRDYELFLFCDNVWGNQEPFFSRFIKWIAEVRYCLQIVIGGIRY